MAIVPKFSSKIDWISASIPSESTFRSLLTGAWIAVRPFSGFWQSAFEHQDTRVHLDTAPTSKDNDFWPEMVTMSGVPLDAVRAYLGINDTEIAQGMHAIGARLSRIDFAIDIRDGSITPQAALEAWKSGALTAKCRRPRQIKEEKLLETDNTGDTVYFGSFSSERRVRIYNKSAEQGLNRDVKWIRLELTVSGQRAHGLLGAIAQHGLDTVMREQFKDYMTWDNAEYIAAMDTENSLYTPPRFERPLTNTQKWLLDTVVASLAKELVADELFVERWNSALSSALTNLNVRIAVEREMKNRALNHD